jgi:hypothetical protein
MSTFPQPPLNDSKNVLSRAWHIWHDRLAKFLSDSAGLIPWTSVSKVGSNLTEITTRNHEDLQNINTATYTHLTAANHTDLTDGGETTLHTHTHNSTTSIQGGTADEYFHLTDAEYDELQRDDVLSVSANTALDDTVRTVLVTATGKTITLPAASADRIGKDWTVILGTTGYTDITRAGSDTLTLPEVSTTIRLRTKGASVTMRCLTATSWGIA